jgi:hypothetical protein
MMLKIEVEVTVICVMHGVVKTYSYWETVSQFTDHGFNDVCSVWMS